MSEPAGQDEKTVTTRTMEIAVAMLFMAAAAVVMYDSWSIGAGWNDGPESGFFPFYIGLAMLVSSSLTLMANIAKSAAESGNFVDRSQFALVLQVFIPTAIFAAMVGYVGIYVSAAAYLAFFMWWLGGYSLLRSLPAGIALSLFLFWLFEKAFVVPLPKGPLEAALGF